MACAAADRSWSCTYVAAAASSLGVTAAAAAAARVRYETLELNPRAVD
jgi:hypothetical protein